MPGTPVILTTSAGGALTTVTNVSSSLITGFSTRFGSTYDQYRILSCDIHVMGNDAAVPISTAGTIISIWWDEKSTSAATFTESQERVAKRIYSNSGAGPAAVCDMHWSVKDISDLGFNAIGTAVTVANLKYYTDTNYGSSATSRIVGVAFPLLRVEFKGIKST